MDNQKEKRRKEEVVRVLLVYPQYPDTFWSFKYALKIVSKKAAYPPLGLLTIAPILPMAWEKKLIDMNIAVLREEDIKWADYVFLSAMITQRDSVKEVIDQCNKLGTKIVAGGPLFTSGYEEFDGIDHFILGEAELILPNFIEDLRNGCPKHLYISEGYPDMRNTPVPQWDLINTKDYVTMAIQYSRGCPRDCEFCDITAMHGRVPRVKDTVQFLRELEALYNQGWRESVFVVDDNFIGNRKQVKKMLPALIQWNKRKDNPFRYLTEADLTLAEDEQLIEMMIEAGFGEVFIGIETPIIASLTECNKYQNVNRDMEVAVKHLQNSGMHVLGGFIVGFDSDPLSVFDEQINFIQKLGIVVAMVGILTALPNTKLYKRLLEEGRLLTTSSGNNTDGSLNFIPKMDAETLMDGYQRIVRTIYSPREYYERIINFLEEYKPRQKKRRFNPNRLNALLKTVWYMGIMGKQRKYYWKLIIKVLLKYRHVAPEAISLMVYGYHFGKIAEDIQER